MNIKLFKQFNKVNAGNTFNTYLPVDPETSEGQRDKTLSLKINTWNEKFSSFATKKRIGNFIQQGGMGNEPEEYLTAKCE